MSLERRLSERGNADSTIAGERACTQIGRDLEPCRDTAATYEFATELLELRGKCAVSGEFWRV
jgi:hypothetical protein